MSGQYAAPPVPSVVVIDSRLRRGRLAAAAVFAVQGLCFAALITRVPALQQKFSFSDGQLALVLLAVPAVAGVGSVLAGYAAARLGSAWVLRVAQPLVCVSLPLIGLSAVRGQLYAAVGLFGLMVGAVDAAMNMQAVAVETGYHRSLLVGFHGVWSAAGIAGALLTAGTARLGFSLPLALGLLGGLGLLGSLVALPWLVPQARVHDVVSAAATTGPIPVVRDAEPVAARAVDGPIEDDELSAALPAVPDSSPVDDALGDDAAAQDGSAAAGTPSPVPRPRAASPGTGVPWRPLLVIGVAVAAMYVADSAISNWSSVFLHNVLHASTGVAAFGYAAYQATLLAGRLVGDRAVAALGPVSVVRAGGVVGMAGLVVVVLATSQTLAVIGFGIAGLGLCVIAPEAFSAAGRLDPAGSGIAVARVNVFNYVGYLVGAPLVGLVGQYSTLRYGFAAALAVLLLVVLTAGGFAAGLRKAVPADPFAILERPIPTDF